MPTPAPAPTPAPTPTSTSKVGSSSHLSNAVNTCQYQCQFMKAIFVPNLSCNRKFKFRLLPLPFPFSIVKYESFGQRYRIKIVSFQTLVGHSVLLSLCPFALSPFRSSAHPSLIVSPLLYFCPSNVDFDRQPERLLVYSPVVLPSHYSAAHLNCLVFSATTLGPAQLG